MTDRAEIDFEDVERRVSREIAPDDDMRGTGPEEYFRAGRLALERVVEALPKGKEPGRVLDFPSGYGRVLRYFRAAWPSAEIVAADLNARAIASAAAQFGAVPFESSPDLARVELPKAAFDLIWAGSLLTHLDARAWRVFLELVRSALAPGGLLVFTTHGRLAAHLAYLADPVYGLSREQLRPMVEAYERDGFGYVPYNPEFVHYGLSLSRPSWVLRHLESWSDCGLVGLREAGWGHQDVYCVGRWAPVYIKPEAP